MTARPVRRWPAWRVLPIAVVAACSVAAIWLSIILLRDQQRIDEEFRYSVTWDSAIALTSSLRLQLEMAALARAEIAQSAANQRGAAQPGGADRDEAMLRYQLMLSSLRTLQKGDIRQMLGGHADHLQTLRDLDTAMQSVAGLIGDLDKPGTAERIGDLLRPLNPRLARLASFASTLDGEKAARAQREIGAHHWELTGLLAALGAMALLLLALLSRRNGLLIGAHRAMQRLADDLGRKSQDLEAANQAVVDANAELRVHNQHFLAALENMSQGLCMVDAAQRLIVCNRRFVEMFGLSGQLPQAGTSILGIIQGEAGTQEGRCLPRALYAEHLLLNQQQRQADFVHEAPDGRALAVCHQPFPDGGWLATYDDVTERRRTEDYIKFIAHHDALTGLPNRMLFGERVVELLRTSMDFQQPLTVLLLDLDHFKEVNDTLGHSAGDSLLRAVAQRLRAATRDADLVARLGGDEFAIILAPGLSRRDAARIAERVVSLIAEPYEIEDVRVAVGASVGIAVQTDDLTSADLLLKFADMALYQAKANGRATWCFYEPLMDQRVKFRHALSSDLRDAVRLGQFEVHYQPLVTLADSRVAGFEALVRWRHPERGMIPPGQFIPLAEESGLISVIGEWVLRQACLEAAGWPARIGVSVNLSPRQFRDGGVTAMVKSVLDSTGLAPGRLELEITESLLLQDGDDVLAALRGLRALGVGVALDDFGTGYSSLSYLRKFPFSKLKIDQSFVRGMDEREDCIIIIQSVAAMAKRLGMTVTAEGIETEDQLAIVGAAGCTNGQGYWFGRPAPAAEASRLIREDETLDPHYHVAI